MTAQPVAWRELPPGSRIRFLSGTGVTVTVELIGPNEGVTSVGPCWLVEVLEGPEAILGPQLLQICQLPPGYCPVGQPVRDFRRLRTEVLEPGVCAVLVGREEAALPFLVNDFEISQY